MDLLKSIAKNKKLIMFLSKDDIKKSYAGSYLGMIWAFIQPCVTILIYWFVFQVGLKAVAPGDYSGMPYIIWIMCGLIPWFFFSGALNSVTGVFLEYSYLVKKVVFDIEILPIIKIISQLFVHIFFIILLFVVMAIFGRYPNIASLQVFYYSFCMIVLVITIGYFTASITVFFRDITQIVGVVLQAGMWLTPIMWSFDMVKGYWFSFIFKLNPMYYVVEGYRSCLLRNEYILTHPYLTIYFWLLVLILAVIGKHIFNKMRPHFADVL